MPEKEVEIGGRHYRIACQPGEEEQLMAAARLLDAEAQSILTSAQRVPEPRLLLMAGLLLADKLTERAWHAETEAERMRTLEDRARRAESRAEALAVQLEKALDHPRPAAQVPQATPAPEPAQAPELSPAPAPAAPDDLFGHSAAQDRAALDLLLVTAARLEELASDSAT